MYKLIIIFILGILPLGAQPRYSPQEVGVQERLGQRALMELPLVDESGKAVRLGSLVDKPTLLTLNFFRCSGVCTPQLIGLLEGVNKVKAEPGKDFQVITVSFDERDTPDMAQQKRDNFLKEMSRPFPPAAWHFLTGRAADTKALADSVGFHFKADGDGFNHVAVLMVLSPKGQITRYLYGVNYPETELLGAITEAGRGEARVSVNKWLRFCYTSDASGANLVFSATRLGAILTLAIVAVFVIVLLISSQRRRRIHVGDPL